MILAGIPSLVGTLYLFYLLLKCLRFLLNLTSTLFGGSLNFKNYGSWAVVTGCTDGIGKEYAKQLAKKGLNIVLMSRSKDKLDDVAKEIETTYNVCTKVIQIDFSGGADIYDDIPMQLEGLEIGVLVNNVGMSYSYPEFFADVSTELIPKIINVNILAMTMLTKFLLPAMVERKRGIIINVSSFSANAPCPMLTVYGATKIYMQKFSNDLRNEYAGQGIIVQSVAPLFVATKMSQIKQSSLAFPSPHDYTKAVLSKVGIQNNCHGYWPHELQASITNLLPEWLVIKQVLKLFKGARARWLKKQKAKTN